MDQLIAIEPGSEGIISGPHDGAKDEARGVELLSYPIGSSGDSSREEASKGKGEPGWFSDILLSYQINKSDQNRFCSFTFWKEIDDKRIRIAYATSSVQMNQYTPGNLLRFDPSDQEEETDEQWSPGLTIGTGGLVGAKEWSTVM